jgi:hypothetical protein
MTKTEGSGFISQRLGSADPVPDPPKCRGSATLAGPQVPRRYSCVTPVKDLENSRSESRTTARQPALLICQVKFPHLKVLSNDKGGGCEWYQSIGLQILYISADFKIFFKGPGPLKNKKRI